MDKVEMALIGIIAIAVIALAYILLTTYVFSGGFGTAPQGRFQSSPVAVNGTSRGTPGVQVPVGNGDSGYFNP